MMVNGLKLPDRLVELMQKGRWKRPADVTVLAEMTGAGWPEGFYFDPLDSMVRETGAIIRLWQDGYGRVYRFTSSDDPDAPRDSTLLDVNHAVVIAGNYDEEMIALDYRESLDAPKVVCSFSPDGRILSWKIIAATFDEFADWLGL